MNEAISQYLEHIKNAESTQETIKHYRKTITRLSRFLSERFNLDQDFAPAIVTPSMLEAYLSDLREKGRAITTRNNYIVIIKEFFEYLETAHTIPTNPSQALTCIRSRKQRRLQPDHEDSKYDEQALVALLHSFDNKPHRLIGLRDRAVLALLLSSGLRAFEACSLNIGHLKQIRKGTIHCIQKGGYYGDCHVSPMCVAYIESYLLARQAVNPYSEDDPLFITQKGGRLTPNALYRSFAVGQKIENLSPGVHVFRKYFITAIEKTYGAGMARDLARHRQLSTTGRYITTSKSERNAAVRSIQVPDMNI